MEIRVLRYFLTVVHEESINRAAEVLHITQPTLSRQLAQLEEEVGVKLFCRGARKITLTNEGMLLRRRAEEILSLVDRTERELAEQEKMVEGEIVIGCGELAAMETLAEWLAVFHEKYPLVRYDIFTATADLVKEQMERGLVDIGVLLEPINVEQFDFIRMKEKERSVVLMRPDDPLAQKESICAKDLEGKPLILPRRTNIRNELSNWLGDSFQEKNVLFTCDLATNGALMVRQGLGYYILIEGALPFYDKEKLVYRPLSPQSVTSSVVAWKRHQPLSTAVAKFIENIQCFSSMNEN